MNRKLVTTFVLLSCAAACASGGGGGYANDASAYDDAGSPHDGGRDARSARSDGGTSSADAGGGGDSAATSPSEDAAPIGPTVSADGSNACAIACDKAVACKMVSASNCTCPSASKIVACAQCWLSHTCDELKQYACLGDCN